MEAIESFIGQLGELEKMGREVEGILTATIDQETVILDRIVENLLPMMRFMDYKIQVHGHSIGYQTKEWLYEYSEEKGLILVNNTKQRSDDRDNRGWYEGDILVLTRSGKFILFTQEGDWSRWQGEHSHFNNTATDMDTKAAIKRYSLQEIVKGLNESFKEAVEKANKKKAMLNSRMTQLQAIENILEGKESA